MLRSLQVRNFAIVDDLALELGPGMTVLTGETGAGKSLLVDALNLAVGERASVDLVRRGAPAAEVNAEFDAPPAAARWLESNSLDEDDDACVLRRVVSADGRSRAFVNARPVPVSRLKALGNLLVDVHGQHAHQSLLSPAAQRDVLDEFGELHAERANVRAAFHAVTGVEAEIAELSDVDDPQARIDYLRYQASELLPYACAGREPERIVAEHRRLAHTGELLEAISRLRALLDDDDSSVQRSLGEAIRTVDACIRFDPGLAQIGEMLGEAQTLVVEATRGIARLGEGVDGDPTRLQALERELGVLQDLARKHRTSIEALPQALESLNAELERLQGIGEALSQAEARRAEARDRYDACARRLSEARSAASARFERAINAALKELGMAAARVAFRVEPGGQDAPGADGVDRVRLLVATNPGQDLAPLARVASGGELSRIALAIQSTTSGTQGVACVVFDEVDAGIGGAVAEVVGRRMRALGGTRQVLAVTHLPQVAAQAHAHLRVRKVEEGGRVSTRLEPLSKDARVDELARMLGGVRLTRKTRDHAREMLDGASAASASGNKRPAA